MENVKKMVHELDHGVGSISCNKETLNALKTELGHIREDADNTNQADLMSMGLMFRDMYHKIVMSDDLLHYVMENFETNYSELCNIKSELFQKIIQEKRSEVIDN